MLDAGDATFVPQGVGVHLPSLSAQPDSYYVAAALALRAPFLVTGNTDAMLLMRVPTYIPTVNVVSEKHRNAAASLSYGHKHRMWMLRTEVDTDDKNTASRAAAGLKAWYEQTPFRVVAAPGIELSTHNLKWTDRMLDSWGEAPNFLLFDIDLSGYDPLGDWRRDLARLETWLMKMTPMGMAMLNIILPKKAPQSVAMCIDTLWQIARSHLPIVSIACEAHPLNLFVDNKARLLETGELYASRSAQNAKLRRNGQDARQEGPTA